MPSVKDVARRAKVSTATVSRVLNESGYVSPELRTRVEQAIQEIGYEVNPFARGLKTNKSHTVGLIISTIENPFFATVVRGVESKIYAMGYNLMLCNTDSNPERERMYLRLLQRKRVDGLIVSTSGGTVDDILASVKRGSPVVLLNRRLSADQEETDMPVDAVLSNSREGARMAVAHLIGHGHRHIGIVAGPSDHLQGAERLMGYKQALAEAGLEEQPELICEGAFTIEGGYAATKRLLTGQAELTALFISNNLMALGAMRAVHECGRKVPDELAIISFDDIDWAPYIAPPLTTVAQLAYQIGVTSANILLGRLSGKIKGSAKEAILPTKLIVRSSCGKHEKQLEHMPELATTYQ